MVNPGIRTVSSRKQTRIGEATTGMRIPRHTVRKTATYLRISVVDSLCLLENSVKDLFP